VAREQNYSSRIVLGSIGMTEAERFMRAGTQLIVYESVRQQSAG
jgi:hypothetical protein